MKLLTGYTHFEDVFRQERRLTAANAHAGYEANGSFGAST